MTGAEPVKFLNLQEPRPPLVNLSRLLPAPSGVQLEQLLPGGRSPNPGSVLKMDLVE